MKTAKDYAALLNGRVYREELSREEEIEARHDRVLIIFGASDDLLELRGIADDELGAWGGRKLGLHFDEDSHTWKPVKGNLINAIWSPEDRDCSWLISTEIPCHEFNIMEDDEVYCVGIAIDEDALFDHYKVN